MTDISPLLAIGRDWWLPANYAVHGRATDTLFYCLFWIVVTIGAGVQVTLVTFLVRYRRGRAGDRPATYTHGNRFAELTWTAIPIVILTVMAVYSKRVWDDYRSSPSLQDPGRSKVMIIGQQFLWNVVYPGPDGTFGRYGIYPHVTDRTWPVGPGGEPTRFAGVLGPAALPADRAAKAVDSYVDQMNPLGKDFADPAGADDDWPAQPGRAIYVPVGRPVEFDITSKDVIHDFYLPNFRAQLYAVPGMVGRLVVTPTQTTAELERASRRTVPVGQVPAEAVLDIGPDTPGAVHDKTGWRYVDSAKKRKPKTIIRDGNVLAPGVAEQLAAAGITTVTCHTPRPFEVVCAQLCGIGHSKMRGELIVLPQAEFDKKYPAFPHAK